jgi:hypothetical protein
MDIISIPVSRAEAEERTFIAKVYGWMCFALIVTGLVAWATWITPDVRNAIFQNRGVFFGLIIAELVLVAVLSAAIFKMSATTAAMVFVGYSALNGLTLSFIFLVYAEASIASTFFITAASFGALSVYGYTTKRDLTTVGSLCFMGLIGLIIASLANFFLHSEGVYWATTYLGVLVFVGLTAYDTQKLKAMAAAGIEEGDVSTKLALLGALALYLDFINLFLLLLRLFGRRR